MNGQSLHTAQRLETLLREHFQPTFLSIRDDSAGHAAHHAARPEDALHGGSGHFRLRIVSTRFVGLKPLQRHRLVNEALAPLFRSEVHALAMEVLTPDEFQD